MGKKRKATARSAEDAPDIAFEPQARKLNIQSYEDVADSEDEFLLQRDKILLDEGPEAKRRRKVREEEELLEASDEEILGLPDSDDDEDESLSEQDEIQDEPDDAAESKRVPRKGKQVDAGEHPEDDDEYEGWGNTRDAYYGADTIDTEQAALEEEAEAKRLQQKQLQSMSEADFEFNGDLDNEFPNEMVDGAAEEVVKEVLPDLQVTDEMSPAERLKMLRQRYPEFEPIAKELLELRSMHAQALVQAQKARELVELRNSVSPTASKLHPAILKYQALTANLGAAAMYFVVLTSGAERSGVGLALPPAELRDHAIMDNLLKSRQLWDSVRDLDYPDIDQQMSALYARIAAEKKSVDLKAGEAEEIAITAVQAPKRKKKSKAQRAAEAAAAEAEARRLEDMRKLEAELASLSNLSPTTSKQAAKLLKKTAPRATGSTAEEDSDFGDETQLTPRQLAEKAQRRKTLRFYTSQIAQKANRRGLAGRDAGGDMDIPHRERFRDRQAKALELAEKRGAPGRPTTVGVDTDDTMARHAPPTVNDEEDYYDMVSSFSKQKKAEKTAAAQAYAQAQKEGGRVISEETIGEDGKRKITYAIEKNKGLTPHRRKEVRNPRVKKRMKYDEKKKKLGSVRQVYRGGEGKGGYGGELTGIKRGVVKSIKL